MAEERDSIYALAEFMHDTPYEEIPELAIEDAKKLFLDIIATSTAGSSADAIPQLRKFVLDAGGKEEARILVYGEKVPAGSAALINTVMSHARDWDDTLEAAICHISVSAINACMITAQSLDRKISGKEFLKAIVMTVDVFARMASASTWSVIKSNFVFTALFAYFASAMGSSLLYGHDVDQIVNSAGIVLSQASGTHQAVFDSVLTKRTQPGWGTRAGVEAAKLTELGLSGCRNVLDGQAGLYNMFVRGNYKRDVITADLGKRWYIEELSYKPYPCCRHTHSAIDDARLIVQKYQVKPEEITGILVETTSQGIGNVCEPADIRRAPKTVVNGQFSIPWTVASMIVNGTVDFDTFEEPNRSNPQVLELAAKTTWKVAPDIEEKYGIGIARVRLTVSTTRGDFVEYAESPLGATDNPMTLDDILGKLEVAKKASARPVKDSGFEKLVDCVEHLEDLDDVDILFDTLFDAFE